MIYAPFHKIIGILIYRKFCCNCLSLNYFSFFTTFVVLQKQTISFRHSRGFLCFIVVVCA